ncbi:MAG: hypothetical protein QOH04_38 [Sphingomonadales bacterium]|jgi:hypothetical protein|nr:hypothetical protein [Sphingomonadales bacterium]
MEQAYWLDRKRASVANARRAGGAEARLVHLDLAGRYSIKAAAAAAAGNRPEQEGARLALPLPETADAERYQRLETGARWMASRSPDEGEREEHLGVANRYVRLRLAAVERR